MNVAGFNISHKLHIFPTIREKSFIPVTIPDFTKISKELLRVFIIKPEKRRRVIDGTRTRTYTRSKFQLNLVTNDIGIIGAIQKITRSRTKLFIRVLQGFIIDTAKNRRRRSAPDINGSRIAVTLIHELANLTSFFRAIHFIHRSRNNTQIKLAPPLFSHDNIKAKIETGKVTEFMTILHQ